MQIITALTVIIDVILSSSSTSSPSLLLGFLSLALCSFSMKMMIDMTMKSNEEETQEDLPERTTRSCKERPLEEKCWSISSRVKVVSMMLGRTLEASETRPSLLPKGTATDGPPVCHENHTQAVTITKNSLPLSRHLLIFLGLTSSTESLAARTRISEQETAPGQKASNTRLASSTT